VTGQGRRGKKQLDDLKERIEEAIDRTLRRTRLGKGYGRVGRQCRMFE
jgi:hypothetical protein